MTCPRSTQFTAYNRITAEQAPPLYPAFVHEALPGLPDRMYQFMLEM